MLQLLTQIALFALVQVHKIMTCENINCFEQRSDREKLVKIYEEICNLSTEISENPVLCTRALTISNLTGGPETTEIPSLAKNIQISAIGGDVELSSTSFSNSLTIVDGSSYTLDGPFENAIDVAFEDSVNITYETCITT